ncbi:aldehyde dehydrogenase family protein [Candidatus Gottesmanbacteria bacterium]|nr:aldehyde dehydrogenase family protein [Candidatus Gottesmanbacteria bacterium]MBI3577354.1 aldehyde dehydrogenase family protein [Candidatus Gottesmanbacteria bacterium]
MPADFFAPVSNHKTPPTYNFFTGERWASSKSGHVAAAISPLDGSVIGKLQVVTPEEIDMVMETARNAQGGWEATPLNQRVKIVHLAADWIRHFEHYLTTLLIKEIGKTHDEARGEIIRTADLMDYYADEVQSITGETLDSDNFPGFEKGRIALVEHAALGIVVAIAPFNYPVNLAASKIAPALLMGNSVVFKPPTQGGISGLHLVRIFEKAGVPPGVLTAVTGGGADIGDYLVSHPRVSMVAFTGSSDTGILIATKAGMVPLLFECGGNNPAVVLPDADMHLAAREIVKGAFSYSGQRCTAIKYVLSTKGVLEQLVPLVKKTLSEMVHMGDPRSPHTKLVGPVISEEYAVHIAEVIDEAVKDGAKVVVGGMRNKNYIEPTILINVKPTMEVVRKETFGPVVSFITVKSMEEATTIINTSSYGLQASVFTKDEGAGIDFAKYLGVGTVQVNGSPQRGPDHFPFLGIKRSGVGVQGVRYSLEAMGRLKPIVLNKPK